MPLCSTSPNSVRCAGLQKREWCLRFGIVQQRTPEPVDAAYLAALVELGRRSGLDHIGVAPASVMHRARTALHTRKGAGLHDTMQFTYRNPERSTDPGRAVQGAQSVLVAARSYAMQEPPTSPSTPSAAVARYAWEDHYAPLRVGLQVIVGRLRADGYRAVAFADDNSMVDREAAWLGGLGWFGKNANVLLPGSGSYFVLGSVVTTAPLPIAAEPVADGCGSCKRCIDGCPTAAIVAPGVVDAGRCLAWLLQRPGVFPRSFRRALGNRIYGCDECQTVCPPTVRFERHRGQPATSSTHAWVPLLELLDGDDDALLGRYGRWYLAERNPIWMRRNALIALGNVVRDGSTASGAGIDDHVIGVLRNYLGHAEPMLRAHAVWAAAEIGLLDMLPTDDTHPLVLDELRALAG